MEHELKVLQRGSPFLFELSPRTVLRLKGPDRLRYLNGQVSQDVRLATSKHAVSACVLNAKGQLEAVCHIREHEDSYLIDAPLELREDLLARLDRYIIADDVELSDESEDWIVSHFIEAEPPTDSGSSKWTAKRLATPGYDLFSHQSIKAGKIPLYPISMYHFIRTVQGVPAWGSELAPGLLPPEAGLEEDSISYEKGCYIGQEIISRMKRAGKTNQHLITCTVPPDTMAPCPLFHGGHEAGRITSVARPPTEGTARAYALGFRRSKFANVDVLELSPEDEDTLPRLARVRPSYADS